MKKFLIAIAACLLSIGANAQSMNKFELSFETGYSSVIEFGDGLAFDSRDYLIQFGQRFHNGFAWGVNTGFVDREHCLNIPISVNLRHYYDNLDNIAYPFTSVSAGSLYDITNGRYGFTSDISGGAEVMIDDEVNAYFKTGLKILYQYETFLAGIVFSVGINF